MRDPSATVDDLISRGIPGAIVTTGFVVGAGAELTMPTNNLTLIGFLAVSYAAGTVIDLHKHDFFSSPPHFRRVLYAETGNEDYIGSLPKIEFWLRKTRAVSGINFILAKLPLLKPLKTDPEYGRSSPFSENGLKLSEVLKKKEYLEVSPDNISEVWIEFERATLPELGRTGQNQHTVYHFLGNFFVAATFSILIIIYGIIVQSPTTTQGLVLVSLAVVIIFAFEINLWGRYSRRYTKRLLRTHYTVLRKEQEDRSQNESRRYPTAPGRHFPNPIRRQN